MLQLDMETGRMIFMHYWQSDIDTLTQLRTDRLLAVGAALF